MMPQATHDQLLAVCRDADYVVWKENQCMHCAFYQELKWDRGADWGVCFNPKSERAGLLSFEHMGCEAWKENEGYWEDEETDKVREITLLSLRDFMEIYGKASEITDWITAKRLEEMKRIRDQSDKQ
jgi:hypothetical protein